MDGVGFSALLEVVLPVARPALLALASSHQATGHYFDWLVYCNAACSHPGWPRRLPRRTRTSGSIMPARHRDLPS